MAEKTYNMVQFLADAKQLQMQIEQEGWHWTRAKRAVKALCEVEIDRIYASESHTVNMPVYRITGYRKALAKQGNTCFFVEMPDYMFEDEMQDRRGVNRTTKESIVRGYFCERIAEMNAKRELRDTVLDERLRKEHVSYGDHVDMLKTRGQDYLNYAATLCYSDNVDDLIVGLLMATGRRNEEIGISARMVPSERPYWVSYRGQLKTRSETREEESRNIPVLVPATLVCEKLPAVQSWVALKMAGRDSDSFNGVVGRHFRRIVEERLQAFTPNGSSPRDLRKCYGALLRESVTPEGEPLYQGDDDYILQIALGHLMVNLPRESYKDYMLPKTNYAFVLPR